MAYCTNEDVTDLTGTSVDSAIITRMITRAERKINIKLKAEGLSAFAGTPPDEIIEACSNFAAAIVLRRTVVDGTTPTSIDVENTTVKMPIDKIIAQHEALGSQILNDYITNTVEAETLGAYKAFAVVGRGGERVGNYGAMSGDEANET